MDTNHMVQLEQKLGSPHNLMQVGIRHKAHNTVQVVGVDDMNPQLHQLEEAQHTQKYKSPAPKTWRKSLVLLLPSHLGS